MIRDARRVEHDLGPAAPYCPRTTANTGGTLVWTETRAEQHRRHAREVRLVRHGRRTPEAVARHTEYVRAWNAEHPESRLAAAARYREAHREQIRERDREYRARRRAAA